LFGQTLPKELQSASGLVSVTVTESVMVTESAMEMLFGLM
jgi:hypothetical protein